MPTVRCSGRLGGGGGVVSAPGRCTPPPPPWTDRRLWKHYLSATTVADDKNTINMEVWLSRNCHLMWCRVFLFCRFTPVIFTARNEVGARLCFYTCVWFCSQGGAIPAFIAGGIPACLAAGGVSPPGGLLPGWGGWGVSSGGGVAFCYSLLLWSSIMAFWFGGLLIEGSLLVWSSGGQEATTPEGHHTRGHNTRRGVPGGDPPPGPHPGRNWGGIRSRPTPKGEIQGDQVQANIQVGNFGGIRTRPPDDYCCGRYVSYWNAFLFLNIYMLINLFRIIIMTHCDALTCYAVA